MKMGDEPVHIPSLVPLFPLPEVVLFPRAVLPLHIFEPRYRKMTADALSGARVMAVALLKPGFEPQYYTRRAPIHSIIGIGHIVASEQLDGGDYNILLRGVARARIVEEVPHKPYRVARIEPFEPAAEVEPGHLDKLRQDLQATLETEPVCESGIQDHWLRLFEIPLGLGDLTDLIASGLPIDAELRQSLLAEADPLVRARALADHLRTLAAVTRARRTPSPNAAWRMN
jgi:Lon protease-like protein